MLHQYFFHFFSRLIPVSLLFSTAVTVAQKQSPIEQQNTAAFLFSYTPKEGMNEQFDAGYKKHLEWHRQHKDPLLWYAWYVVFGDRLGMFIDGCFGSTFAAFDERVSPAEDRVDFEQTTAPYADPVFRTAYTLRSDLSTATPLEDRKPSPMVHVGYYQIHPGKQAAFEKVLRAVKQYLQNVTDSLDMTWYELTAGGNPIYMLMVPLSGWSDYPKASFSLEKLIRQGYNVNKADSFLEAIATSIDQRGSEIWAYQSDLSYFPEKE